VLGSRPCDVDCEKHGSGEENGGEQVRSARQVESGARGDGFLKTWVNKTGPIIPVTARRELMPPCNLPCEEGSTCLAMSD